MAESASKMSRYLSSPASALYGLKYHCRCIVPQIGNTDSHAFLVGTNRLGKENEIHHIEYVEDSNEIVCLSVMKHAHEVWDICPSPSDPDLFFTTYNEGSKRGVSLWRLPSLDDDDDAAAATLTNKQSPTELVSLPAENVGAVQKVMWDPTSEGKAAASVVTLRNDGVDLWQLDEGRSKITEAVRAVMPACTRAWLSACLAARLQTHRAVVVFLLVSLFASAAAPRR